MGARLMERDLGCDHGGWQLGVSDQGGKVDWWLIDVSLLEFGIV